MGDNPRAALKRRSVLIAGHRTSVSLETAFWEALKAIATTRRLSINQLVAAIDDARSTNLSSAIRVYVLDWFRSSEKTTGPRIEDAGSADTELTAGARGYAGVRAAAGPG